MTTATAPKRRTARRTAPPTPQRRKLLDEIAEALAPLRRDNRPAWDDFAPSPRPRQRTGHGLGMMVNPPLPAVPTDAPPGSEAKIAVLEERARLGQQLFHPLDAGARKPAWVENQDVTYDADQLAEMTETWGDGEDAGRECPKRYGKGERYDYAKHRRRLLEAG